jgi:hypothetical protein
MNKVFALAACISVLAVAAFAAEPAPYLTANPEPGSALGGGGHKGSDAVLVDNLCTSAAQIMNGLSGCAYPAHNSWVAFDYTPTSSVTVRQVTFHYLYNSAPLKNTINFQLYSGTNPGVGSIVRSWNVAAAGYEEKLTGWSKWGRPVYVATVPIPDQALTGSTKYWFAYRSPNTASANIVYWCVQSTLKEEQVWWYLNSRWGPGSSQGAGGTYDQSYRLEDVATVGIAPTSFGRIKTLYH